MDKSVGIILVNYKDYAKHYLTACRNSLRQQNYSANKIKVYIIDNDSSSESLAYLGSLYPESKIIARADGNYCAANNLGFKEAIKDGCDYLVTVNMDTEMEPDWLYELVLALENNADAGISQSKILLYPEKLSSAAPLKINTLGNRLQFLGFGFTSHYNQADFLVEGYPEIKGYASGCCFITSPEVFLKIGGWDEEYYMYHDDIEFSLKARLTGYKIILAPKSVIFHKYEFARSVRMLYYMERNRYLLALNFYPAIVLFFLFPAFIIMGLGMLVFALMKGWGRTWFKALVYFVKPATWSKIYNARKSIAKIKKVKFSALAVDIEGKIDFPEINNPILKYLVNPVLNSYWSLVKKII